MTRGWLSYIILSVYTNMLNSIDHTTDIVKAPMLDEIKLNNNCEFTIADMLVKEEDIERASRSLKAISHPLRLKILCVLGDKEVSVQDIVDHVGTSQSNISQHLAILRDKGILASRKDANRVYYRVGDYRTLRLISMMQEVFCSAPH